VAKLARTAIAAIGRKKKPRRSALPRARPGAADALVSLIGVPSWTQEGPASIAFNPPGTITNVDGAISAIAVKPMDPNTVFVGTVNGGI
jgi:hypothetical protein